MKHLLSIILLLIFLIGCDDDEDSSENGWHLHTFFDEECLITKQVSVSEGDTTLMNSYEIVDGRIVSSNNFVKVLGIDIESENTYEYESSHRLVVTSDNGTINYYTRNGNSVIHETGEIGGKRNLSTRIKMENGYVRYKEEFQDGEITSIIEVERTTDSVFQKQYFFQGGAKVLVAEMVYADFDGKKTPNDFPFNYKLYESNPRYFRSDIRK
jgi:hypothetical protein